MRILLALLIIGSSGLAVAQDKPQATDPLPSWNDGKLKSAIINFVETVTDENSPDFVPAEKRIATFDNDGTLWTEQSMCFQLFLAFDRAKALTPEHPEWKTIQPFKGVLEDDLKAVMAGGKKSLLEFVAATHAGMTAEEFEEIVKERISTAKHPMTETLHKDKAIDNALKRGWIVVDVKNDWKVIYPAD